MPRRLPRTAYQFFETLVAAVLTFTVGIVIVVALYRLVVSVVDTLLLQAHNPLAPQVFQAVFGEIMTLLIALEFNHTLQFVITQERSIVQARVVILIALLAIVRKVIVVDLYHSTPESLAALAGLVVALGVTYWLMCDGDERTRGPRPRPAPALVFLPVPGSRAARSRARRPQRGLGA
jgi:uncharacterized membrane protein (DUF373 family)